MLCRRGYIVSMTSKNKDAFLALVKAGLWEKDVRLLQVNNINYSEVYRLAQEQSVVGLIAAGLEHVVDTKIPQDIALTLAGEALQLEQRNKSMNYFIGVIVDKMRDAGVYALLVKGQGIAQCYERPLWRACGDVDFLLSDSNYASAKEYLTPLAISIDKEDQFEKHIGYTIDSWLVELHGSLKTGITSRIDKGIIVLQNEVFYSGSVRSWMNGNTQVFIPGVNIDVLFIFTHILKHFFHNGIGLRQICDWCRLLWKFRDKIDVCLLESRIREMGIITEWKAFASLAVNYLGMPVEAMPLYSDEEKWKKKAGKILAFIFKTGNFGHNRDTSYSKKYPAPISKLISFYRHTKDSVRYFTIFPMDTVKSWWKMVKFGFRDLKD